MKQQTLEAIGFYDVLKDIAEQTRMDRARETILRMTPLVNQSQMTHKMTEIEEAMRILTRSGSVPIHVVDDIAQMIMQAKKGLFIRADQFTRVISFLEHCSKLKRFMNDKQEIAPLISSYAFSIDDLSSVEEQLTSAIRNGQVDEYASKELSYLRRQKKVALERLKTKVEHLASGGKYKSFLQDKMVSTRQGRYVLSIKKEYRNKVNGTVLDTSASGSTLFIEPAEVSDIQEEVSMYTYAEEAEVERILFELTEALLAQEQTISIAMDVMHEYDVLFAKAKYCREIEGIKPSLSNDRTIKLVRARHPALGQKAVPLTLTFGGAVDRALVITGPNTGGKTVTLKTVGLLTAMAQAGLLIPAEKGSQIGIFQSIFVDIGDGQSIEDNLSTFSSRMVSIIEILREANDRSLVLLDELGSGTDPNEGMGLAITILNQLYKKGSTLFATTHYSEMKTFADDTDGFINGSMEFDVESLQPTYRLLIGESGKSQAFEIALKLGLHPSIVEEAHQLSYGQKRSYQDRFSAEALQSDAFRKQVIFNRHANKQKKTLSSDVEVFQQGDNVTIQATNETAIIYKGPDEKGNYIVQVKDDKRIINHKRLTLHISAEELYPADYDFDIIFKSKTYRKVKNDQSRKHLDGIWLEEE
ncbi:endonuclease MutS2 [Shouchella lehensis]|uniref:DNA mismatch repair protein MutS n=1 Tax=Shouchella lehensis G1 TaxID=1246626 RepID=A0A060LPN7_9BACI|nr:DNA mismatch repair protein [Shouchella lehensis]AIC93301.1 DNA mismatch repair protein MutS [Shouchella lehensis G1]RQW22854.1 endonuclease MutS2 [Bacillus sp. C1-1]